MSQPKDSKVYHPLFKLLVVNDKGEEITILSIFARNLYHAMKRAKAMAKGAKVYPLPSSKQPGGLSHA